MKRILILILMSLTVSSCILFIYDYSSSSMSGQWLVKNNTQKEMFFRRWGSGISAYELDGSKVAPGDSLLIYNSYGLTYMPPPFKDFLIIDSIQVCVSSIPLPQILKVWHQEDMRVVEHSVFDERSWSCNKEFGRNVWVFEINEEDIRQDESVNP